MKLGILSDTHGLLRPEALTALVGCEAIFHGGDINNQKILDELGTIAPVYVVRGNNDKEWAAHLPETIDMEYKGIRIFMVHNKKYLPKDLTPYDLVLYGHSHKYEERREGHTLILNPGSCGPRRFHQEITLVILEITLTGECLKKQQDIKIQKISIPHRSPAESKYGSSPYQESPEEYVEEKLPADLALRLPDIMQDIDKGRTIKQIAKKYKLSEELSEQIARMYLTHPGVDVDGIMRRLGV